MLWIHAGPHKAASSYVTERLRQNREHLAAQGVLMDGDNNRLANAIAEKNYGPIGGSCHASFPFEQGFAQ